MTEGIDNALLERFEQEIWSKVPHLEEEEGEAKVVNATPLIDIFRAINMDFMLEEELIDLYTFCLQNPDSSEIEQKKARITEVGKEIFDDGGVDALENFYFAISNRIQGEIEKDIAPFRPLWNGLSDEWKY